MIAMVMMADQEEGVHLKKRRNEVNQLVDVDEVIKLPVRNKDGFLILETHRLG